MKARLRGLAPMASNRNRISIAEGKSHQGESRSMIRFGQLNNSVSKADPMMSLKKRSNLMSNRSFGDDLSEDLE